MEKNVNLQQSYSKNRHCNACLPTSFYSQRYPMIQPHQHFAQIIQQLNQAQWEAVRNIEGPVLAIAGPGTGKTHMLTARIGQILMQTDAQPHNVLCLTFTDAGVHAMRQRLLEFIGTDAHRVHIFTFHSFCNKIIQENIELFGRYNLQPLSELERIEVIRLILYRLPAEHPLRIAQRDMYHYEGHLGDLFRRMKSEHWSAQYVSDMIDDYLATLPSRPEFIYQRTQGKYKRGDLRQTKIEETVQRMERLRAAAWLFEEYKAELHHRQRYDYEDMILWVLEAFGSYEFLLRRYQEQYLYVLVDEYQDTNGAQNELIERLMSYWGDSPNIFIVGDDDQAIYEFQGARIKNMLDFFQRYRREVLLVQLQENYRSTQSILDVSKNLIDHNKIRLVQHLPALADGKKLWAVNHHVAHLPTKIRVKIYKNRIQEEVDIVRQIVALKKQQVPLQQIAIIFARHRQARNIIRLLEKHQIPYKTKRRLNILELPLLRSLRQILRYFAHELQQPRSADELLFEVLHYNFIGIPAADLSHLNALFIKDLQQKYQEKDYEHVTTWYDLLHRVDVSELQQPARLAQVVDFIDNVLTEAYQCTLSELIEKIYNRSGLLQFVLDSPQKAWLLEVLHTFFEFVQQETDRAPHLTLNELLDIWQRMEDNRLELGLYKTNYSEQGVQLLTAHSSKGLEFNHVFMINCLKDYWEPSGENRGQRFAFPETLTFSNETDQLEAARRLFYVAMTRAKEGLQLSYFELDEREKMQERTQFLDEIIKSPHIEATEEIVPEIALSDEQELLLTTPLVPHADQLDTDTLAGILADFRMSVSSLTAYLYCPLSFYYEYVLRIPHTASNEAMYGTAVHEALKKLFDTADRHEHHELPNVDFFIAQFEDFFKRQKIRPTVRTYYQNLAQTQLRNYYQQRAEDWQQQIRRQTVWTERHFKQLVIEGVPVTGIVDKLVLHKENDVQFWNVIDYKTGKLQADRLAPPSPSNPNGGTYWRQLIFYKLLVESSGITLHPVRQAQIDYLTPNGNGVFEQKAIEISREDVEQFKAILKNTYRSIQQHEFTQGCGKRSCKWCNFVKRVEVAERFNNPDVEELDDLAKTV